VPRATARTVERGKNPEDGTGGGLATLTHSAAVERSWWSEKGAPGVVALEGARTQERRNPGLGRALITRKNERSCVTEQGQSVHGTVLQESETPREELRAQARGQVARGRPRGPVTNGRGGSAGSHEGATRAAPRNSAGDSNSTRARTGAGNRARPPRIGRESLDGQTTRTATRRHPQG